MKTFIKNKQHSSKMILWLSLSFLIFLPHSVLCDQIVIGSHSSNAADLRNTQNAFNWTSNQIYNLLNSSGISKDDDFHRLDNATIVDSKIKPKKKIGSPQFPHFIGSNLFDGDRKQCFSIEDMNLLAARQEFEEVLIPRTMPAIILDDESIGVIMRYFSYGHLFLRSMEESVTERILKKAFFDTFGGFLHHYLLPVVKMSYYVGDVQLQTVDKVLDYYKYIRFFLNTNGNGWRSPYRYSLHEVRGFDYKNIFTGEHTAFNNEFNEDYCNGLSLLGNKDSDIFDERIIVPMPKIDLEDKDGYLGNIWLPYQRKTIFCLRSYESAFLLAKFYKKVSLCYMQKDIPQESFDIQFKQWIAENLLGHVFDEEFYPSLGGLISLYKNLYMPKRSKYTNDNAEDVSGINDDKNATNGIENRIFGNKQKRKTFKYAELERKSKVVGEKNKDWLQMAHTGDVNKKFHKRNRMNYNKESNETAKNYEEEEDELNKDVNYFDEDNNQVDKNKPQKAYEDSSTKTNYFQSVMDILKFVIYFVLTLLFLCGVWNIISILSHKCPRQSGGGGGVPSKNRTKKCLTKTYKILLKICEYMFCKLKKCFNKNKKKVNKSVSHNELCETSKQGPKTPFNNENLEKRTEKNTVISIENNIKSPTSTRNDKNTTLRNEDPQRSKSQEKSKAKSTEKGFLSLFKKKRKSASSEKEIMDLKLPSNKSRTDELIFTDEINGSTSSDESIEKNKNRSKRDSKKHAHELKTKYPSLESNNKKKTGSFRKRSKKTSSESSSESVILGKQPAKKVRKSNRSSSKSRTRILAGKINETTDSFSSDSSEGWKTFYDS